MTQNLSMTTGFNLSHLLQQETECWGAIFTWGSQSWTQNDQTGHHWIIQGIISVL